MRKVIMGVLALSLLTFSGAAKAQNRSAATAIDTQASGATVWGSLAWHGIGAGVRWSIPLADGLIKGSADVHDQFSLDVGADAYFDWFWAPLSIRPSLGLMWVFWLNHGTIGLYPKADLALLVTPFAPVAGYYWGYDSPIHWDGGPAVGAFFKTKGATFRVEAGGGYWGEYTYSGYLSLGVTVGI